MKKLFRKKPKVIVVLGQTATGKSDLAVELAKHFDGEVISADSRQVYRGMDLGSGKITKGEMQGVPHHLLDVASPQETFTVADFQKLGKEAIEDILTRGKVPIVCGGTGFYIDALVYEMDFPAVPPNEELRKELGEKSLEELQEIYFSLVRESQKKSLQNWWKEKFFQVKNSLKKVLDSRFRGNDKGVYGNGKGIYENDKEKSENDKRENRNNEEKSGNDERKSEDDKKYQRSPRRSAHAPLLAMTNNIDHSAPRNDIDLQNPVRLIRAIEIIQTLGYLPKVKKKHPYDVLFIGLTLPKEKLDKRIYERIVKRLDQGMLDEAKKLLQEGVNHERLQALGLEYRYMSKYLLGELSYEEMIDELFRATKRFARRQRTWFKRNREIHWFSSEFFVKNPDAQKYADETQKNAGNMKRKIFSLVQRFLKNK